MGVATYPVAGTTVTAARPVYVRATVFGLLTFAVGALMLIVEALIAGDGGFAVFAALFTVVPLALSGLVWRFGSWALIVSAVLMVVGLLFVAPVLPVGLANPDSFFDFAPVVVTVTGAVIALIAAVVAFVQDRRGSGRTVMSSGQRQAAFAIVAVLAVASLASGIATLTNRSSVSATAKSGATEVKMKSSKFEPLRVNVRVGQPAKVLVKNADPAVHTFTIKQLGIDYTITPGSEKLVELNAPAGTYTYVCTVHSGMTGTLTISQ